MAEYEDICVCVCCAVPPIKETTRRVTVALLQLTAFYGNARHKIKINKCKTKETEAMSSPHIHDLLWS